MAPGRYVLGTVDRLIDRILCVIGAVVFAQAPEFMQQYLQRLGGHLAEARRQLAAFEGAARQAGLTFDRLVEQTATNPDLAVARLADVMTATAERVSQLQRAHDALLHAGAWERPAIFLRHLDRAIAHSAAAVFQPAVPTTAEGLVYACAGLVVVLAIYQLALKLLSRAVRARSTRITRSAA